MNIYSAEKIKAWDEYTIRMEHISSVDLMERAASIAESHIFLGHRFDSVTIFCGVGNNGGDGLVIARLLHQRGISVKVYIVEFSQHRSADFQINLKRLSRKIPIEILTKNKFKTKFENDLIVDAIFGSGLNKPVTGWVGKVIEQINQSGVPIVSIDLPSGLFIQNNNYEGSIVKATSTITFQTPKFSFFFSESDQFIGNWTAVNIGLHQSFNSESIADFITEENVKLKKPGKFDHKGNRGFLTLIAGMGPMGGAALLSAKAALRTGCGYTSVICNPEHQSALLSFCPEALAHVHHKKLPEKTKAIAIGPGITTAPYSLKYLKIALKAKLPIVIDADAINILAKYKKLLSDVPANAILTPHTAELERLIGKFSDSESRLNAQRKFSKKYKVFIIQKGAYSKLTTPKGEILVNSTGNCGMAKAGMGDVLTGMIGSLLAQGYPPNEAAVFGMYLHGRAGDLAAAEIGQLGLLASDLIGAIPEVFKEFQNLK